jgi:hypothetical protein
MLAAQAAFCGACALRLEKTCAAVAYVGDVIHPLLRDTDCFAPKHLGCWAEIRIRFLFDR